MPQARYQFQPRYQPDAMPQQGYGSGDRFPGYDRFGDVRSFLMHRYSQALALHATRIQKTAMNLALWKSEEHAIFGGPRKRDDEERIKSSKPNRLVEMFCGLIWSKDPSIQVASVRQTPYYTKSAAQLEMDALTLCDAWKVWRAWKRAVFWSVIGGVGPIEYYYNPLAMDDEPLIVVSEIDPRTCVWKESIAKDGTLDYVITVKDEMLGDIVRKWEPETIGNWQLDDLAVRQPTYLMRTYTYWSVERTRGPDGKPMRAVVNAVWTDAGWLREPTIMRGYTKLPIVLLRGTDYPLEHEDESLAYMGALDPVRDELIQEIRMLSALLTAGKYHTNPAYLARTDRQDIKDRVDPSRGGFNWIYADEQFEPLMRAQTGTPDVQMVMKLLGDGVQGGTVPEMFQGNMELKDISGVTMSVSSTGPLIRFATRQKLLEDALEQFLAPMFACLARHCVTEDRTIVAVGNNPRNQNGFHMAVLSPQDTMQLDGDVRIIAKTSSSLPRDVINELMTVAGLVRDGVFSKDLLRRHALRTMDLGHTNADAEEQRIAYEQMWMMQFQNTLQQGPFAPPTIENDYVPPGYQRMGDGSTQRDPFHQPGPYEPLMQGPMVERRPGPRYGPATHDQLTGRGNEPTNNPSLHRKRANDFVTRAGAMMPMYPRR